MLIYYVLTVNDVTVGGFKKTMILCVLVLEQILVHYVLRSNQKFPSKNKSSKQLRVRHQLKFQRDNGFAITSPIVACRFHRARKEIIMQPIAFIIVLTKTSTQQFSNCRLSSLN